MKVVIFDLDNCISDDRWRRHHIKRQDVPARNRYHDYHSLMGFDCPRNLHLLLKHGDAQIVIFTGRPEAYRAVTLEWLHRNNINFKMLFMRANFDHRPNPEVKRRHLKALLLSVWKEDIVCAYDDRLDVVEMYREQGIMAEEVAIDV